MNKMLKVSPLLAVLLLGACATIPNGPAVMALPGTGKNFDEFRANDAECRQYASSQIGTTPNDAAVDSAVASAVVGTAVGALAGAMIGGHGGAGVGAGTGLMVGAAAGAGNSQYSGRTMQQRYDISYQQCMYARGNRVPVSGRFETSRPVPVSARPVYGPPPSYGPPPAYAPPPPPGYSHPPSSGSSYYPPPPPVSQQRLDRQ
jgi:outer membrane lipoprotein SlyB